ncbi:MAG: hypothetical protein ACM3PX_01620 [Omnitrophica WOR_2 bacterium]|jgi:hypothetical protein
MSFLQLILFIFVLYLFLRLFSQYIAPWLVKLFIKRIKRKFFEQNPYARPPSEEAEGNVTIHNVKDQKDNEIPPDLGEYIDYEELNNNQKPTDE